MSHANARSDSNEADADYAPPCNHGQLAGRHQQMHWRASPAPAATEAAGLGGIIRYAAQPLASSGIQDSKQRRHSDSSRFPQANATPPTKSKGVGASIIKSLTRSRRATPTVRLVRVVTRDSCRESCRAAARASLPHTNFGRQHGPLLLRHASHPI